MKRFLTILLALVCTLMIGAQKKTTTTTKRKAATSAVQQRKPAAKSSTVKKSVSTTTKKTQTKRSSTAKTTTSKSSANVSTAEIRGLRNQRAAIQKKIKEQERLLQANKADVKKRLDNLFVINSEIEQHQRSINDIEKDITHIDGNIDLLKTQLATLEQQLSDRKQKYVKSLRYMARHRNIQDELMFIFSAKSLTQMYRRLRFVRAYGSYQRAQGVKQKQEQIVSKHQELERVKKEKNSLLYKGKKEQVALQDKQQEQKKMVTDLQRQQKTIQGIIDDQRKKDQELNAQIDRLVAEEVAKARIRAAEEARRKAAEAAAAKKKREEELARKKAEAERAAKENELRVKEARERERRLKEQAREAARKRSAEEAERAEREALAAQAEREAAERKAEVDRNRHDREVAEAKRENEAVREMNTEDRKLSSNFANNKGRLPMPLTGKIVRHYGQYCVEGLRGVTLDSKGINIKGAPGASVRCIFNGVVSRVFGFGNTKVVMVRHGSYISVYCNLASVNVNVGQQVSTRQTLGSVGSDQTLQFQLYRQTTKLNPEVWLGR